jgi:U4/U6 small nuclear ribonucleoprotein PRP3
MEWWDENFLPKALKEKRRQSRALMDIDDFPSLSLANCKTHKYIQHPVPVRPLGGDKADEPLPMFLTKKERKRIRRKAREEREREKRDMQMMGLIKAPEPKFKLSNFMKILGDQAVADPSKVEQRVMQQVHERQLMHEMRNLAAKLTPAEKREKLRRKMTEDTSRQVAVALFRVKDLSSGRHRFKVDVNAQQWNLSGAVLMCQVIDANMVIVEGGMKGIKKFVRLMLHRINWDKVDDDTKNIGEAHEGGSDDEDDEISNVKSSGFRFQV